MGTFISRVTVMVLGYIFPAYKCYKLAENQESDVNQLVFWCQYWILLALFTISERVCDNIVSWIPFYHEAKVALFVYLWHPKTRGTSYIYSCWIKPYVSKHEEEIDSILTKLKKDAEKMASAVWEKALSCSQHRLFQALQYASSSQYSKPS